MRISLETYGYNKTFRKEKEICNKLKRKMNKLKQIAVKHELNTILTKLEKCNLKTINCIGATRLLKIKKNSVFKK